MWPRFGSGASSAYVELIVDAMDILHSADKKVDTLVLMTSDGDLTRRVQRFHEVNRTVVGVGRRKSSSYSLVKACHSYIFTEDILACNDKSRVQEVVLQEEKRIQKPQRLLEEEQRQVKREPDGNPEDLEQINAAVKILAEGREGLNCRCRRSGTNQGSYWRASVASGR